jgi:MFS transporter, AAHS family, 4-hydroxybenzoate transporter
VFPEYGWRSVFWLGGALPLLLGFAMLSALPESVQFLVLKGHTERARRWLAKFDPMLLIHANTCIVVRDKAEDGARSQNCSVPAAVRSR